MIALGRVISDGFGHTAEEQASKSITQRGKDAKLAEVNNGLLSWPRLPAKTPRVLYFFFATSAPLRLCVMLFQFCAEKRFWRGEIGQAQWHWH